MALHTNPDPASPVAAATDDGARSHHRADIQGLRAVAVVLVVAFHAGLPVPGGFVGVDMFFVVSGFVIGAMLLRQMSQSDRLGSRDFYTRRMRRLLPALSTLLVVVALAATLLLSPFGPQQATARTGIAGSLFSANLQLAATSSGGYFQQAATTNGLLHIWSLSVEEQFYFVFPALLFVAWRLGIRLAPRHRRRVTGAVVLATTAGSFAISLWATLNPDEHLARVQRFGFYSPVTRAWEFGVGILLALGATLLVRATRRIGPALGVAGAVLLVIAAVAISDATPFPGFAALLPVLGTALLIVAGMTTDKGVTAALGVRPATRLGDLSYGWYLWHWPLIVFAAALWPGVTWVLVLIAVLSLVPAWLVHRSIETPIRFDQRFTGRRVVALVAVCIATPVVAFLGLLLVNRLELRSSAVRAYSAATAAHSYGPGPCDGSSLTTDRPCTWPVKDPRGTVVLIGDSNAGQFAEVAAEAANTRGYDLTVVSVGGCPFGDVIAESAPSIGFDGVACNQSVWDSLGHLVGSDPALVILSTSSTQLVSIQDAPLTDPRTGEVATTPEDRARVWEAGETRVLESLDTAGIPTVLVHTVPNFFGLGRDWWDSSTCPAIRIYTDSCGRTLARTAVEQQQRPAREAEERARASVPAVTTIDFTDDLCTDVTCATRRDGLWIYRDGTHLSVAGAMTLVDRFGELIDAHATRP